jgi:rubrerythrin
MSEEIKLVCMCQRCQQIFEAIAPKQCPYCGCGEVKQVKAQKFTKEVTLNSLKIAVPFSKTVELKTSRESDENDE